MKRTSSGTVITRCQCAALRGCGGTVRDPTTDFCVHQIDPENRLYEQLLRKGWSQRRAKLALHAYTKFFALKVKESDYDATKLSPTDEIDIVWHAHILDTLYYADCCHRLVGGRMVHHDPVGSFELSQEQRKIRARNTLVAYKEFYGREPPEDEAAWVYDFYVGHHFYAFQYPSGGSLVTTENVLLHQNTSLTDVLRHLGVVGPVQVYSEGEFRQVPLTSKLSDQAGRFVRFLSEEDFVYRRDATSDRRTSRVSVKTLTGKNVVVDVDLSERGDFTFELKEILQLIEGIPTDQQLLVFSGHQLDDGERLCNANIVDGSQLHLLLKLRGC